MTPAESAVLMVSHAWGGGIERHIGDLARILTRAGVRVMLCHHVRGNPTIAEVTTWGDDAEGARITIDLTGDPQGLADVLRECDVRHVHIHSFAHYAPGAPHFFREGIHAAGLAYDITVHDYGTFCPRFHLVGVTSLYCGEPALDSCQRCVNHLGPFGIPSIAEWRATHGALLRDARTVFVPCEDVAERITRHFPGLQVVLRPHPEAEAPEILTRSASSPARDRNADAERSVTRIGALGALSPGKGSYVIRETALSAVAQNLPLAFHVIGVLSWDADLASVPNITETGRYQESDLVRLIREADLDALWFPNVMPETYSYTLSTALRTDLPLAAFDIGAVAERLRQSGRGVLHPLEAAFDVAALARLLVDLPRTYVAELGEPRPVPVELAYPEPLRSFYGFVDNRLP